MPVRRALISLACAIAVLAAAAPAAPAATKNLWATVNVCDTTKHPDAVGVAARMPGNGTSQRMYMRFYMQYLDGDKWRFVKTGGISPWLYGGSAKYSWVGLGYTFGFDPPAAGTSFTFRGFVRYEWRDGKTKVVKRTHRYTSDGHPGTRDADPKDFSSRKCKMSGPAAP
ncbi:MAG: hypothetical protein QOE06_630 [Thermoleophilaceae bacterium]|jgi:hypothetical protein|nr:hypothetical protein [Thermoleophilaceae bacterium]